MEESDAKKRGRAAPERGPLDLGILPRWAPRVSISTSLPLQAVEELRDLSESLNRSMADLLSEGVRLVKQRSVKQEDQPLSGAK